MTERLPGIDVQSLERVTVDCVVLFGVHLVLFFFAWLSIHNWVEFTFIIIVNLNNKFPSRATEKKMFIGSTKLKCVINVWEKDRMAKKNTRVIQWQGEIKTSFKLHNLFSGGQKKNIRRVFITRSTWRYDKEVWVCIRLFHWISSRWWAFMRVKCLHIGNKLQYAHMLGIKKVDI